MTALGIIAAFVPSKVEREADELEHFRPSGSGSPSERDELKGPASAGATGIWRGLNLGELVAHPAGGQYVAGVLGVGLYLLAYVADLHVCRTRVPREVGAPHGRH